jgi:hypothetical protein
MINLSCSRTDAIAEEKGDFVCGRIRAVGAVANILLDAVSKISTNGTRVRICWIRGAHYFAMFSDSIFAFKHLHYDRAGHHVADQIGVERPLTVNSLKTFRLLGAELWHARCHDLQPRFLEATVDLANQVLLYAIRFDD